MDYQRIYDQFIADRRAKCDIKVQTPGRELHHVKPRGGGFGGTDDPENLISFVPSDHLFAHRLLAKIHGGAMTSALFMMLNNSRYNGRCSRRLYEHTREQYIKVVGALNRGKPQHPNLIAAVAQYNAIRKLPKEIQGEFRQQKLLPRLHASKLPRSPAQLAALEKGRKLRTPAQLTALEKGRKAQSTTDRLAALEKTWRLPRSPAQLAASSKNIAKGRASALLAFERRKQRKNIIAQ